MNLPHHSDEPVIEESHYAVQEGYVKIVVSDEKSTLI